MYEVLPTEPLHDVKEHIANVVSEITHHLTDVEKVAFQQTLELVSGTKDQLRGSDYLRNGYSAGQTTQRLGSVT